ncbi:hypothetical protein [Planomonospora venezuelensis]|uniref:Chitinase n=1 Tax=Planomonospora venezuelensis TaxID=1999 RepID=A0A841D485_PLAVE|nr:hypothetical protein [Planomonospora venezuelensis]MBB5964289.1 hypothetical protein [Planomonospora venezuelensis]GIN02607.1 hypothetical protein Pve01_42650 [Planomonospora venezuelensis]
MPTATARPAARHAREPGTPPRSLVALAAILLAATTGAAVWLLPAEADEWAGPARAARPERLGAATAPPAGRPAAERVADSGAAAPAAGGPSGFVTFVDAARTPLFGLPSAADPQDGARWFALGHLTAGRDGCTLRWGGRQGQGGDPVPGRLDRLRAAGGVAGLVFGGPTGRELSGACAVPATLTAAYRKAVGDFGAAYLDFEVQDSADDETVLRRAEAITALQEEAREGGRSLAVGFTLPATETGLAPRDQMMLRATREAGVRISVVNLLVPIRPASAGQSRLRPVASAVRAARPQVAEALAEPVTEGRIALTSVLAGPESLSPADARKMVAFAARNHLAWLSTRGAAPDPEVVRLLSAPPL